MIRKVLKQQSRQNNSGHIILITDVPIAFAPPDHAFVQSLLHLHLVITKILQSFKPLLGTLTSGKEPVQHIRAAHFPTAIRPYLQGWLLPAVRCPDVVCKPLSDTANTIVNQNTGILKPGQALLNRLPNIPIPLDNSFSVAAHRCRKSWLNLLPGKERYDKGD